MGIPIVIGLLFALIGFAVLVGSIVSFLKVRRQVANSSNASGVVSALITGMGKSGHLYYPQVQFTAASGQPVTFQSSVGSNPAGYSVGQTVGVLYDQRNPQQAEIDSAQSLWFVPGCMFAMGLLFLVLGLFLAGIMILVVVNQP
ncbi:MAG: DUF3592 domain-containing protein [Pyrinomonadaceae bacterium]